MSERKSGRVGCLILTQERFVCPPRRGRGKIFQFGPLESYRLFRESLQEAAGGSHFNPFARPRVRLPVANMRSPLLRCQCLALKLSECQLLLSPIPLRALILHTKIVPLTNQVNLSILSLVVCWHDDKTLGRGIKTNLAHPPARSSKRPGS